MDINELLKYAVTHDASDVHISSGSPAVIRVDGDLIKLNTAPLASHTVQEMVFSIMNDRQMREFKEKLEVDFSFEITGLARFRANVYMQQYGPAAAFRTIPDHLMNLEELKAPSILQKIAEFPRGLVLVTGPTGSGKSTTLAAMVDYINDNFPYHILTVEDPIEFVHKNKRSLINQREVHRDTHSFNAALRVALREDPDVILVGELRDLETIRLALTAAETGHLVFATLHTTSAPKSIDRIIDVFPGEEKAMVRSMLSESLRAVIAQLLLKKQGGGRIASYEIMLATHAIKNLIREDKVAQMYSAIQTGGALGMQTMEQSLTKLRDAGHISAAQVRSKLGMIGE